MKIVLLLAGLMAMPALAGVYKWTDKDGKVHYGDRPPEEGQAQEVNRSGLPMALQDRLRNLDRNFIITRVTGNLETAYVCGQFVEATGEPRFAEALSRAKLGEVADSNSSYSDRRRGYYNPQSTEGKRCPEQRKSETNTGLAQRLYKIQFNPETVRVYRDMAN